MTDRSQILEILHDRRDEIADKWLKALASTNVFVPLKAVEVRQRLVELTEQAIALMLTEAFDQAAAQDIGAALARLRYTQPEALGHTQEVLARQLVQGLPPDQAVALQPRLAALLGGLVAGFLQQTCDIILAEQEQIRDALVSKLQETETALREARDWLEMQVEQRTAELTTANEDLRIEIAERKRAEEGQRRALAEALQVTHALRESEERYRTLQANVPVAVFRTTPQGKVISVNPATVHMMGYDSEEEILGILAQDFYAVKEQRQALLERIDTGEVISNFEVQARRKDGSTIWISASIQPVFDEEGKLLYLDSAGKDITERKRVEEALHRRTEVLDALRQMSLDLTAQLNPEVLLHSVVSRAMELLDGTASGLTLYYAEQDILKRAVNVGRAIMPVGTVFQRGEGISGAIWETGKPLVIDDYHAPVKEAATAEAPGVVAILGVPIHWGSADAGGEFLGTLVVKAEPPRTFSSADVELLSLFATHAAIAIRNARLYEALQEAYDKLEVRVQERTAELAGVNQALRAEIDQRKRVEQALRESEEIARALLNAPTDLALLVDPNGTIIDLNEAATKNLGRDASELIGTCVFDLFPPDVAEHRKNLGEQVIRSGKPVLFEDERGGRRFSQSVYPVFDAQGNVMQLALFIRDVTEHRQMEQALRESEERYRALFKSAPIGIGVVDREGNILAFNDAMLAGYTREEIVEMGHVTNMYYDPGDRAESLALIQEQGSLRQHEVRIRRKDGTYFYVVINAVPIRWDGRHCWQVMAVDITERKRAEEMLRNQADRLSILHEIDRAILAAQSSEEIARATLAHVQKLVPCRRACVILLEQDTAGARGPEGTLLATRGCDRTGSQEGARFPLDELLLDRLRRSDVVVIESSPTSSRPSPTCQASQLEEPYTYVQVPLVSQGELIGCLSLGTEEAGPFTPQHLDVVQQVADSLAIAVQHHRLVASLEHQGQQLRALGARVAEIEEDERQRLARDLHDLVGPNLTAMGINLNLIRTNLPEGTKEMVHSRLADSLTLVEETTDLIRLVIADLRPPVLDDLGLVAALQWYGREFASRTGISVSVEGDELAPRLGTSIENVLFRIAQEALTNVTKHAQATYVTMVVTSDNEHARLVITDNGIGFDPAGTTVSNGHHGWGLMTMAERAEAMGGRCWIESRPQQGTKVIVEIAR